MFGLSGKGFKRKRYDDVLESMLQRARDLFGTNVNLSERSPLGLFIRVIAWNIGLLWQLIEKVYNASFPDTADGINLDKTAKFIGITRQQATRARYLVEFIGEVETEIPKGFKVQTASGVTFETLVQERLDEGGTVFIQVEALEPGAQGNVSLEAINEIPNPIAGLNEIKAIERTFQGKDTEDDMSFRERYDLSVTRGGSSNIESIRARLLDTVGVIDAFVIENDSMETLDGIPPKSVAPYVYGGEDDQIAQAIYQVKSGGIQAFGTVQVDVVDSIGNVHKIGFIRPDTVDVYVHVKLTTNELFPLDGRETVRKNIIEYIGGVDESGDEFVGIGIDDDVIYTKLIAVIHKVTGIEDIELNLGVDNESVTQTSNLAIDFDKVAYTSFEKVVVL